MSDTTITDYFTVTEYGSHNTKPIFIFGGWLTAPLHFSRFIKQLLRHDFHCILYIPRRRLIAIGTEYAEVIKAASLAVEDVRRRLSEYEGDQAAVFGVSFGTAFAMEVGKQCKTIKRIALIAPPGDFEKHVEVWQKQPYFKRIVAAQPTTPAESGRILNKIGTLKRIDLLKDKQILVGYIKNDRVMHSEIAKELVLRLEAANITTTVLEVKGGHNAGLFRYVFNKAYLEFLIET